MRTGLQPEQLGDLLGRPLVATLATHRRNGEVLLSPIWYEWQQDGFNIVIDSSGFKAKHIRRDPHVSVVVYESGPDGPQGIGCNNVLGALPSQSSNQTIIEPRGMCYSPYPDPEGLYAGGVFVAHRDENGFGLITHIQFTHQALYGPLPCVLPPGRFYISPGFNVHLFDIVGRWGDNDGSRLLGSKPSSVVLDDFRAEAYRMIPAQPPSNDLRGAPGYGGASSRHPIRFLAPSDPRFPHMPVVEPDRMYVAFEDSDTIQILDPVRVGVTVGTVEPAGIGIKKLISYYSSQ